MWELWSFNLCLLYVFGDKNSLEMIYATIAQIKVHPSQVSVWNTEHFFQSKGIHILILNYLN